MVRCQTFIHYKFFKQMTWTSIMLKYTKSVVLGLMVLTALWFMLRLAKRLLARKDIVQVAEPLFVETDHISFVPKAGLHDVDSDKTVDAILSGAFGPAVVVFRAEWCQHCRNMEDALQIAAAESTVPFVRVSGQKTPVSNKKYAVMGYPTILGVANVGGPPRRYNSLRTSEALKEFATGLGGQTVLGPSVALQAPVHAQAPVAIQVPLQATLQSPQQPQQQPPQQPTIARVAVAPIVEHLDT